ncbi:MAG TPA: hypothetical protein VGX48_18535 [Pyrinomonadaceae bacterium]|jgi:hypothetical protein|nr:hypothetical protein [Pyrinomonadaceae bacterium]
MANKKTDPKQQPNVKFVGRERQEYGKTIRPEPFERVTDGGHEIELPPAEAQRAGFFHPDAARLVRLHPSLYKFMV